MKYLTLAASAVFALALAACGPQSNTAEKAGEAMDTQAEQAATGDTNLSDGPMENAGEAVDTAKENAAETAQDAATAEDKQH